MKDYTFFSYAVNEALHLSERERNTIIDCFKKIDDEINYGGDKHSNTIIASAIELFLNYCLRFYDRQFITRKKVNKDLLIRFEELIDGYFISGKAQNHGTPSVAWCVSQLCLSPNYFGDLIKKETGRIALDYIQQKTCSFIRKNQSAKLHTILAINIRNILVVHSKKLSAARQTNIAGNPTKIKRIVATSNYAFVF